MAEAVFGALIGQSPEAQPIAGAQAIWKNSAITRLITDRNSMVEMVKFVTSLSSNELNASLQPFYKAAQAYSIDPSENKEKLQDAINKSVDAFIAGKFTVEDINEKYQSHMGISLEAKSKDIKAKALPKLAPLKGDVPSRQEFIETNLQMQGKGLAIGSEYESVDEGGAEPKPVRWAKGNTGRYYDKGDLIFHFAGDNERRGVVPACIKLHKPKSGPNSTGDQILTFTVKDKKVLNSDKDGNGVPVKHHMFITTLKKEED